MKKNVTRADIPNLVKTELIPRLKTHRIFTFTGSLGAGKTTTVKELLSQCGITEPVTSPTFTYVNTYQAPSGCTFHHFDLYRLETIGAFVAAGFDELLAQQDAYCLIEWPACISELLQHPPLNQQVCSISISYDPAHENLRLFHITP